MIDIKNRGEHRVQVFRDGECIKDTGIFKNLLLDGFFSRLTNKSAEGFNQGASAQICGAGSGVAPAIPSNTTLQSPLGYKVGSTFVTAFVQTTATAHVFSATRVFSFSPGSIVGNVSELGTIIDRNNPSTSNPLDTRAILPTTVTVTAADQLVVTHIRYVEIPFNDVTGSLLLDGSNYNYVIRPANVTKPDVAGLVLNPRLWAVGTMASLYFGGQGGSSGALPVTSGASWSGPGGSTFNSSPVLATHTSPTLLEGGFDITYEPAVANISGGIKLLNMMSLNSVIVLFAVQFTPNIPKTSSQRLRLDFKFTYSRG